ncbi:MAG: dockerin type I repeat-containing protein [Muribaculaceae bacterium]|nr:dockerin type I repeat-containing protein [Muribaculaceae bacterium]
MKKIAILLCTVLVALAAWAQYSGPGFYRVRNVYTDSYICIRGTHFEKTTTPEAFWPCALMQKDSAQVCDPGSIIFIPDTLQVGLYSQGVDTYSLTGLLLDVMLAPVMEQGLMTYVAYTQYIPDPVNNPDKPFPCYFRDYGLGMTAGSSPRRAESHWWIEPVNEGSVDSSYFGVRPVSVNYSDADGCYWTSLCCDFPALIPEGGGVVGAYTVREVEQGEDKIYYANAVKVWGQGEVIPAATPVLLKCASPYMSGNKLIPVGDIANQKTMPIGNDLLLGNYFSVFQNHCSFNDAAAMKDYIPEQATLATTMDFALGVDGKGKIGFFPQQPGTYMAANTAWLNLRAVDVKGAQAVYLVEKADEVLPGDVDGNGEVDIDDLTDLINLLLESSVSTASGPDDPRDFNGDGLIDIDDVTKLINWLLFN